MICLLTLAVLLMAQSPDVDTSRAPVKTISMSYTENVPMDHKVDLSADREGNVQIRFERFKINCTDKTHKTCWDSYQQSKLLAPEQIDELFKPVDVGKWRYFVTQIDGAKGAGDFSLEVVSKRETSRKKGNIYDAMSNESLSRIRKQVLKLAEQWFPKGASSKQ